MRHELLKRAGTQARATGRMLSMRRLPRRHLRAHRVLMLAAQIHPVLAIDLTKHLAEFSCTCWSARDGAPASVGDIAQTLDEYLWLATAVGLYRFDGQRFDLFKLPNGVSPITGYMSALYSARSGELRMGTPFVEIFTIRN
jgi:ligand-binding sensor domain-containing protein